jgi:hypothetical protein
MYKKSPECLGIVSGSCTIRIPAKTPAMLRLFMASLSPSMQMPGPYLKLMSVPFTSLPIHVSLPFCHPALYNPSAVKSTEQLKNAKHCEEWHRDSVKLTVPCATGSGNSNQLTLLALGNEGACYTGERGPSVTGNRSSPTVEGGVAGFWCKN